jgi:hypothetical protein
MYVNQINFFVAILLDYTNKGLPNTNRSDGKTRPIIAVRVMEAIPMYTESMYVGMVRLFYFMPGASR